MADPSTVGQPAGVKADGTPVSPPLTDEQRQALADEWAAEASRLWAATVSAARSSLAADAEAARQCFITPGPGKALTYEQKQREAEAIMAILAAEGTPLAADYPLAADRADRLGTTLQAVAEEWTARAAAWLAAAVTIEAAYETALSAIDAADTPADVAAALAAVTWPLPA